jgi:hypothetical protein
MSSSQSSCAACNRTIDSGAKLCPFCGANPATGERLDTEALVQEVFRPRTVTTSESVMEYARQRQGVVITVSAFVLFLILAGLHQWATLRNASAVSDSPAVPLTEITDVTKKPDETTPVPMPTLDFQYEGAPRRMRTYVVEKGAVTPPEVIAAQQAAAAAKAAAPPPPRPIPAAQPPSARPQAR